MEAIKCALVGCGCVGKTCLLKSYIAKCFQDEYKATAYETYSVDVTVDGHPVNMNLWDTAGVSDYDRLRQGFFRKMDVFLICFSFESPESLENVSQKWFPEVRRLCPKSPIILVGTKLDTNDDTETVKRLKSRNKTPVIFHRGLAKAEEIGAVKFLACSALTMKGVNAVFEEAVRVVLNQRKEKKRKKKWFVCLT